MARYFFDIYDDSGVCRDEEGFELPHPGRARDDAMGTLHQLARDAGRHHQGKDRQEFGADVRNSTGQVIFTATVSVSARWTIKAMQVLPRS